MSLERAVFDLKAATVLRPSATLLRELVGNERLEPAADRALQQGDSIGGRVTESARLPDGRVIAGDFLTEIFVPEPDAGRQCQLHQQADHSIVLRVSPIGAPDAREGTDLPAAVRLVVPAGATRIVRSAAAGDGAGPRDRGSRS